jgi:hypothetical protein
MRRDLEHAVAALNRGRKYASWFEWPEKELKELGVVRELLASIASLGTHDLREPKANRPDPPDCVCLGTGGRRVAVEVAEVVCERAAELNAQGHDVYRDWRQGELEAHIRRLLHEKDTKQFHGGPYAETLVCLFTDEPVLSRDFAARELAQVRFGPLQQITGAYLLFSYDPGTQRYPVLELAIDA